MWAVLAHAIPLKWKNLLVNTGTKQREIRPLEASPINQLIHCVAYVFHVPY